MAGFGEALSADNLRQAVAHSQNRQATLSYGRPPPASSFEAPAGRFRMRLSGAPARYSPTPRIEMQNTDPY
ncbi:hypothetical protein CO667_28335 [Rhizobium sp. L43]|nr:hypothetical protein CO667_28335 [Rhizobium sp. L43]